MPRKLNVKYENKTFTGYISCLCFEWKFVSGAYGFKSTEYTICKNIFACLFSVCNTISLSRQEQACLIGILLFNHQQLCYQQVCLIMTIIV